MNPLERDTQKSIVGYLEALGCGVIQYAVPGGHEALRGAVPPGHPDLVALRFGRILWIEVKRLGRELTLTQDAFHVFLRAHGFNVIVAYSVEDVRDNLHLLGLEVADRLL